MMLRDAGGCREEESDRPGIKFTKTELFVQQTPLELFVDPGFTQCPRDLRSITGISLPTVHHHDVVLI